MKPVNTTRKSWRFKWRGGRDLSLTTRISRSAFAVTMITAVTLGCVMLTITLIEIPQRQRENHRTAARVIGEVLSGDLNAQLNDLRQLSQSSLIWTALTDSTGREATLRPIFTEREREPGGYPVQLFDYRGRPMLGYLPNALPSDHLERMLTNTLKTLEPGVAITMVDDKPVLLAVFPVLYPYTKEAIGVLARTINLSELFSKRTSGLGLGQNLAAELSHQGQSLPGYPGAAFRRYFPANHDLVMSEKVEGGALAVRVYATHNPLTMAVLQLVAVSVLLAAMLGALMWRVSGVVARRMTQRLEQLVAACDAISEGRPTTIAEDASADEIGILSRTLRKAVDAYANIYANLESLIEQKTRQLAESQLLLRTVIDETPDLICMLDKDGRFLLGNLALAKFYGETPDKLIGKNEGDFRPGHRQVEFELAQQNIRAVLTSGETQIILEQVTNPETGEPCHFQSVKKPLKGSDGEPALLVVRHDVSKLRHAQQMIEERERQYAYALDATGEGLWDWNIRAGSAAHSARWYELLGLTPLDTPEPVEDFLARVHPDDRDSVLAALQKALKETGDYRNEHRMQRADGTLIWVLDRGRVVERDGAGQPLRMVGSFAEITEQKNNAAELAKYRFHLEELLAERTQSLMQTNRELTVARQLAEQANKAKGEFLANMSHEIRTPMNAVIGLSQVLLETELTDRQKDHLNKIYLSSTALLGILNDILDHSKIEAGLLRIDCTPLRIKDVLATTKAIFEYQAEEKNLALEIKVSPGVPAVMQGDPLRLGQIINNLVGNALKFTDHGSVEITVDCIEQTGQAVLLRIAVRDTGIGLTPAQLDRLFAAFQQADASTTRKYGGTGLGLSISKRLAELMGGEIGVDSAAGEGSTFWFTAKLVRSAGPREAAPPDHWKNMDFSAVENDGRPRERWEDLRCLTASIRGSRILVVDDDAASQLIVTDYLNKMGLLVETVNDGTLAVGKLAQTHFDAVLMDLLMPEMDGFAAARAIRAHKAGKNLPLIALTAAVADTDISACEAASLNDHVPKPIDPAQLARTLVKWIAAHTDGASASDHERPDIPAKQVDQAGGGNILPGAIVDVVVLAPQLQALAQLLGNRQNKARQVSANIESLLTGTTLGAPYAPIAKEIARLNFEAALRQLKLFTRKQALRRS